ncbi:MAG TPA: citrate/2-methylcitrate synthase [Anaerolineae bacterium]|nr:citrate/2-methylcitrate synthase [Anaerolineae bacterium]
MNPRPDYQLFDQTTTAIIYNLQAAAIQRMLDFDHLCRRVTPSVAAIVNPTGENGYHKAYFGSREMLIPIYRSLAEAATAHPDADVMVNFASFRSAFDSTMAALETPTIRTVAVIAEGVPERQARIMAAKAQLLHKVIIGPATVGGLAAGAFKIGNTGGTPDNIIEAKLHRAGSVGYVGKSGGLTNETFNIVARNADGVYEGIAIGGDAYPGSRLIDHLLRYQANPAIKMLVCLGELGGAEEYAIAEALRDGRITKPLVIWVTGTCAKVFPTNVQFGHAGAKADHEAETADAKNAALRAAGAIVPESFDDFGDKIHDTYQALRDKGIIAPLTEPTPPPMPMDYATAVKQGLIRKPTNFISSISDDRGEELTYNKLPITDVIERELGIGGVIGLLWFKRELPEFARRFIELAVVITADHGPAVSGAHNAIVTARAGKDLVSAMASGLLTIGPRFGGAIDDAARMFKSALDRGLTPAQFVDECKVQGKLIMGIGHRVKSVQNPDMRVTLIKQFAKEHFTTTALLDFALEVEKITTSKRNNLILNVDGCIGICFVDMLTSCGYSAEEIDAIVDLGYLNGLFVLGRSIGLMGHVFDQKRLEQPLYRHPWDDILYL